MRLLLCHCLTCLASGLLFCKSRSFLAHLILSCCTLSSSHVISSASGTEIKYVTACQSGLHLELHLINIHNFQIFQPISIKDDSIQGVLLDMSQSPPGVLKWLSLLSRCLLQCLLSLLLFLFSSSRAHLSFIFPHHQTFVLITLKLLFLVSVLLSLIRSRVFRSLFSMAEGGCEKFPNHWNTEFFWTVIMEYISHGHPVDILIKRWVMIIPLFSFSLCFYFFF